MGRIKRGIAKVTGIEKLLDRRTRVLEANFNRQTALLRDKLKASEVSAAAERARAERAEYLYRTTRRVVTNYSDLAVTFDRLERHEYGSLVPGVERWTQKWDKPDGKRILLFANRDFAGSFYKWASAINEHTKHAARLVVTVPHRFGYDLDLLLPNPVLVESDWRTLWDEADLIHLKDETGFYHGPNRLPDEMISEFDGPIIFTQYGGYARKQQDEPEYQEFVRGFDAVVSMTPDLCFEWLGSSPIYIPHSVDTERFRFSWSDKPTIGHSPSTRSRKGTEDFLNAVGRLREDGHELQLDLIENVSHHEVMARKRELGFFFDQAGRESIASLGTDAVIGWYGNSAIEAAVFGIPTIAHLSNQALEGAQRAGVAEIQQIPFLNTPLGTDGIRSTIRSLLELDGNERAELAQSTRQFVEEFHSQEAVASRLNHLYQTLL